MACCPSFQVLTVPLLRSPSACSCTFIGNMLKINLATGEQHDGAPAVLCFVPTALPLHCGIFNSVSVKGDT
jgi:hypothetical protein